MKKTWREIEECGVGNCYASVDREGNFIFCTRYSDKLFHCETKNRETGHMSIHPKAHKNLSDAKRFFENENESNPTLYQRLTDAGIETSSWQSDLYVKKSDDALKVIKEYEDQNKIKIPLVSFVSNIDGKLWWDIPFGYLCEFMTNLL